MLCISNKISAQVDSMSNRSMDDTYQQPNSNTMKQDGNIIDHDQDAGSMPTQDDNTGNMHNQMNENGIITNGGDSMNMDKRNKKNSSGTSHHSSMQDTKHVEKPVQPVTSVNATRPVKTLPPVKNTQNKNNIKTTKNKTMYLVPDSTKRKDTLK